MQGSAGEGKAGPSQAPWSEKGPRAEDLRGVEVSGGRNEPVVFTPSLCPRLVLKVCSSRSSLLHPFCSGGFSRS